MNLFKIACLTLALSVAGSAGASIPLVDVETTTRVKTPTITTTQVQSTTTTSNTSGVGVSTGVTTGTIAPSVNTNTVASFNMSSIITDEDLSAYVESQMSADTNLKNVTHTDSSVTVAYKQPAKLFGLIPSSLTATTEIKADGTVTVSYPWYAFLYSKTVTSTDLETSISSTVSGLLVAETIITPEAKAEIVSRIQTTLAGSFTTKTNTTVETETTSDTSASY